MAKRKYIKKNLEPIVNAVTTKPVDIIREQIKMKTTLSRTRQDILSFRNALAAAENELNPNRVELYRLYKDIVMDAHIASLIDTRKKAILASDFIVIKKGGKEIEDKTDFISKKWFYDFVFHSMDSIFWGHSLIQFGYDLVLDEFANIELVPRQYVKPEKSIVVSNPYLDAGQSYLVSPYKEWVIGVGEKCDLGLLAKAAPLYIWKKNALSDWSNYLQLMGIPTRVGKTSARDKETRQNMYDMLENMGSAAFGVFDIDDEIQLIETKSNSPFEIFDKLIDRCNSELSKLILGQTSTSDQKAYVGSAGVHERVMHQITEADQIFIENIFAYQLIPLLNAHNFGFNKLKIKVKEDDELTLLEKSKIDLELLKYYKIPVEYIKEVYGTDVIEKEVTTDAENPQETKAPDEEVDTIQNRLRDYYGDTEL